MIRRICPAHLSADEYGLILAEKFDAHRIEVLTEAGVKYDTCRVCGAAFSIGTSCGTCDFRARIAAEIGDKTTAPPAVPDFFQAEHTYRRGIYEFRCLAITADPRSGEPRAVGLRSRGGWPWDGAALDPDDWEHGGWTDITDTTTGAST